jgi:hypothetical protein
MEVPMYASVQKHDVPTSALFRYCGRAGALIIVVGWLALVIVEFFRSGPPVIGNYYQGGMLAIVFVGYAIGRRNEALGGALAITGTIGFVALNAALFAYLPISGALGFAAPGMFYLIAHYLDRRHVVQREWGP